jgi:hypothetical protein
LDKWLKCSQHLQENCCPTVGNPNFVEYGDDDDDDDDDDKSISLILSQG